MAVNISTLTINASLQTVWAAITQPEYVKLWQFGSALDTTWEVNTPIKFSSEWEGKIYKQWGTVLTYEPYTSLSYSLYAENATMPDIPENYFIMEYKLVEINNQTQLTISKIDNRKGAIQEAPEDESNPILAGLKKLIESIKPQ